MKLSKNSDKCQKMFFLNIIKRGSIFPVGGEIHYLLNVLTNVPWNRCINSLVSINEEARAARGSFVENLEFIVYGASRGIYSKDNVSHPQLEISNLKIYILGKECRKS